MTDKQIKKDLIESRESFTQSIRHTYVGYQEKIDAVDKIPKTIKFLEKEFPGHRLVAEWDADPECHEANSIFINIYFPNCTDIKEIFDIRNVVSHKFCKLFPIASKSIILSGQRDGLNE